VPDNIATSTTVVSQLLLKKGIVALSEEDPNASGPVGSDVSVNEEGKVDAGALSITNARIGDGRSRYREQGISAGWRHESRDVDVEAV
jgi:hypothetical protein